jgi:hypothetical protein
VRTGLNVYERDESRSYFRDLYSFDAITGFSQDLESVVPGEDPRHHPSDLGRIVRDDNRP